MVIWHRLIVIACLMLFMCQLFNGCMSLFMPMKKTYVSFDHNFVPFDQGWVEFVLFDYVCHLFCPFQLVVLFD
jgi:hypothetical protein